MKTVFIKNGIAQEIIPDYALPVEKWYGVEFAVQCVEAPDDVRQGWVYDPETGTFSEPAAAGIETLKSAKNAELNAACEAVITGGCDVTLSDGTVGHISLSAEDQINLSAAMQAVEGGASGYPYHLDGELCTVYSASDIRIMAMAATAHKLLHTTLCNHYHVWVNRCTTAEEVQAITYGCELPGDLQSNLEAVINAVST